MQPGIPKHQYNPRISYNHQKSGATTDSLISGAKRPLGNTADLASRAEKERKKRKAFQLQKTAREILPGDHRIQKCYRYSAYGTTYSTIETNGDRSRLSGVHTCDCGYACPVCAPKIAMRHAKELAAACTAAYAKGWRVLHVTYTLSHHRGESLEKVLSSIAAARRKYFLAGRAFQTIKSEVGIEGSARSLECTHGDNGWHPHFHELLFISGEVPEAFEATLRSKWMEAVRKVGGVADYEHGLRLEEGSKNISEYLNKMGHLPVEGGHSVEMELSHGYGKVARKDGKTPFALLESAADGNETDGLLFKEYVSAMSNRALIRWSKGLREALGMAGLPQLAECSDENTFKEIAALEWQALKVISDHCIMPAVLLAATAGFEVLSMFLADYDLVPDVDMPRLFVRRSLLDRYRKVYT